MHNIPTAIIEKVQYSTVECNKVKYSTIQYSTIKYITIPGNDYSNSKELLASLECVSPEQN